MPLSPVERTAAHWTPQPQSDLYSTGASGAVPVRPVNAVNAMASTDELGASAIVRISGKTGIPEAIQHDWTLAQPEKEKPKVEEPPPREDPGATIEYDPFAEEEPEGEEEKDEAAEDEGDVLEDTPDFLQETPEHDRLWFEQKPPRDFDFE